MSLIFIFNIIIPPLLVALFIFYLNKMSERSKNIIEKIYKPLSRKFNRISENLQSFRETLDNMEYEYIENDKLLLAKEIFKKFFNKINKLDDNIKEYNKLVKIVEDFKNAILQKNIDKIKNVIEKLPDFGRNFALESQIPLSIHMENSQQKESFNIFYRNKEDKPVYHTFDKKVIEEMREELSKNKDIKLLIEKRNRLIKDVNELHKKLESYMKHQVKTVAELLFEDIFLWFKNVKQINMRNIYITILSKIIILMILLAILSYSTTSLSSTNEYLPYDNYAFTVSVDTNNSDATVGRFQIFYDFSYQKGSIDFDYRNIINPNAIEIELPKSLIVTNISIKNYEYGYVDKNFYNIIDYESSIEHLRIDNFSKSIIDSKISIDFSTNNSTIYPNGRYILNIIGVKNIYFKSPEFSGGGDGNESMIFSLGKYRCLNPCLSERDNAEEKIINNNVIISSSQQNKRWIKFIISAFDESKIVDRDFVFSIISGIIVSLIFLFVTWIDHFFNWITSKI